MSYSIWIQQGIKVIDSLTSMFKQNDVISNLNLMQPVTHF